VYHMRYHVKREGSRSASYLSICGGQRTRTALYVGCSLWRTPGSRHHGSDPSTQRPFGSLSPVVTSVGSGAICQGNLAYTVALQLIEVDPTIETATNRGLTIQQPAFHSLTQFRQLVVAETPVGRRAVRDG
jgi:hypothetical protein